MGQRTDHRLSQIARNWQIVVPERVWPKVREYAASCCTGRWWNTAPRAPAPGQVWRASSQFGPYQAQFGRQCPKSGRVWAKVGQASSTIIILMFARIGPDPSNLARLWPCLAGVDPNRPHSKEWRFPARARSELLAPEGRGCGSRDLAAFAHLVYKAVAQAGVARIGDCVLVRPGTSKLNGVWMASCRRLNDGPTRKRSAQQISPVAMLCPSRSIRLRACQPDSRCGSGDVVDQRQWSTSASSLSIDPLSPLQICRTDWHRQETLSSLRYASRAKTITNQRPGPPSTPWPHSHPTRFGVSS